MPNFILLIIVFVCSTFTSFQNSADSIPSSAVSADSVIKRSEKAYASLKVYLDSGKVITEYSNSSSPHKRALLFKTAYENSGDFNFEYFELGKSNSLYTINRSKNIVQSWWGITRKTTSDKTLQQSLMAASGVSSGLSSMVPQLLLADFRGKKNLFDFSQPVMEGVQTVGGLSCFAISGTGRGNGKVKIWIAEKDFLIRKIETDKTIDTRETGTLADSILSKKFKVDSAALQKRLDVETNFQKKASLLNELDSLRKERDKFFALRKMSRELVHDPKLSIKSVYMYYPYQMTVPDKKLFSFRPDREIEL